ncbi:hypothetical protein L218DRAFT_952912 [Marasmius fiardii PR-910]|nr:hypothetical protein L218DRAFT_952912 [Marasmius fiardii PR-910]
MRFFTVLAATATFGFTVAQEAARFGYVSVNPSTTSRGQTIEITYNSTTAVHQPQFVDFYLQGQISAQRPTPYILLSRNSYGANDRVLIRDVTIPPVGDSMNNGWDLWAFVTFDDGLGVSEVGGIASGLTIN